MNTKKKKKTESNLAKCEVKKNAVTIWKVKKTPILTNEIYEKCSDHLKKTPILTNEMRKIHEAHKVSK